MIIDCVTIFPEMFEGFINNSIIKRSIEKGIVEIRFHDFRDYSTNKHNKVDDTVYGGGAGMLVSIEPVVGCLKDIDGYKDALKILTSPCGELYNQKLALDLSKQEHIIIIAGHYEGIDDRIENYVDKSISIGDYILTGGEIPAITIMDSIIRLLEGSLNKDSIEDESFSKDLLEYKQYTKPSSFEGLDVPECLVNGNHEEIRKFKIYSSIKRTYENRMDLIEKYEFSQEEVFYLDAIKKGLSLEDANQYVKESLKLAKRKRK